MKRWRQRKIEKFSKSGPGLIFCDGCQAVYYKKSWHHNLRNYKNLKENLPVKFLLCPACRMIKNKQFEGEIIVKNAPARIKNNLINLVKAFCRRAYQKDPLDRLIAVKETRDGIKITTTENQLAVKLAKKIKDVFKKVKLKISYSPAPSDTTYIILEFLPNKFDKSS